MMTYRRLLRDRCRGLMRLALLLTLLLGGVGCAQFASLSESVFYVSPEQERQLGSQFATQVSQQSKMVDDPAIVNYVRQVGQRVWKNSPQSEIQAQFFVVQDDSINAFAIPGGNIYVNTGLIAAADDEAELASVIAHEAGHVIRRHGIRQASREQGMQLGVNAVEQLLTYGGGSQNAALIGTLIGKTAGQGVMFRYSRQDEAEADAIAVRTLARAGYDPNAMMRFFRKLESKYGSSGPVATLFSSHPPTSERIANVQSIIKTLPSGRAEAPVTDLRRVQGTMRAKGLAPSAK